jgi:hypothetical protein
VRGLVFNLLRSAASDAGCESDAWDVLTEFAAAEARVQGLGQATSRRDESPSVRLLLAAEALLSCMTGVALQRAGASGPRSTPGQR